MVYIAKFAKEIGADTINFHKLRIEKYSPLKEVVETTPGYHYDDIGGPAYSDRYGLQELKRIRNRIRSEFYNVPQLLRIAGKARRIGLIDGRDAAGMLLKLPLVAYSLLRRHAQKKKRRRQAARAHQPTGEERSHVTV